MFNQFQFLFHQLLMNKQITVSL